MRPRIGFRTAGLVGCAFALGACAGETEDEAVLDDVSDLRTQYVEITDFLEGADRARWSETMTKLRPSFDQICGDTFCGGAFSNIRSLSFACSVSSRVGNVRDCLWTFAASEDWVFGTTGAARSSVAFFECRIRPSGRAVGLARAFGDDALASVLPGLEGPLRDQLVECLRQPTFYFPPPDVRDGPNFVSVLDTAAGETSEAFVAMSNLMAKEFEAKCAGALCGGETRNRAPLRFNCSERVSDGQLGHCTWSIASSDVDRDSRGQSHANPRSRMCDVPVAGTLADLLEALKPGDTGTLLLDRALPGSGETLAGALAGCL
jgi:hypothetical protein